MSFITFFILMPFSLIFFFQVVGSWQVFMDFRKFCLTAFIFFNIYMFKFLKCMTRMTVLDDTFWAYGKIAVFTIDFFFSCCVELAFFYRKFWFSLIVKNHFLVIGIWILWVFVSACSHVCWWQSLLLNWQLFSQSSVSLTKTQWALSSIISRGSATGVRNCQTSCTCTIPNLQLINKTSLALLCFFFFYHINKVIETIGISLLSD